MFDIQIGVMYESSSLPGSWNWIFQPPDKMVGELEQEKTDLNPRPLLPIDFFGSFLDSLSKIKIVACKKLLVLWL